MNNKLNQITEQDESNRRPMSQTHQFTQYIFSVDTFTIVKSHRVCSVVLFISATMRHCLFDLHGSVETLGERL